MSDSDVNAFLDKFEADQAAAETPAAVAAEAPETPAPVVDPNPAAVEAGDPEDAEQFPREYVQKLRKEAASYRERAKRYQDAFDGFEDSDQEVLLGLAKTLREDPSKGAQEMATIAAAILEQMGVNADPDPGGEPEYMTVEKYKEMQRQDALEAEARQIARQAEDLGYKQGSAKYKYLLAVAETVPDFDLAKAHAQIQAEAKAEVDRYLAEKQAQAEGSPGVPTSGSAPSGERQIKTLKDSRRAAMEYLEGLR